MESRDASSVDRVIEVHSTGLRSWVVVVVIASMWSSIRNPQHRIFMGELDGEPIGYIQCEAVERGGNALCLAQAFIYLHHIVVKSTYRNQGYGKQLMQAAFEFAKASGHRAVRLDYWSFNREATEFFARLGFTVYREFAWVSIGDGG